MSKKIKILHILPNLSGGGAEKVCLQILIGLDKNKFKTYLLLFKDNDKQVGIIEKRQLERSGVKIISLKKKYLFDFINFFQIIKNLNKIKADVLHCHLGGDVYGPLASYFIKKPKIISTEHNINISEKRLANFLKRLSVGRIDKILAVSKAVKRDAIKRYNIKKQKIDIVYNGVDLNYYNLKTKKRPKNEPIILGSMGRLNKQKGHSDLIKACSLLKNQNYILEIAGEGHLKESLEKQIKSLNLENKVTLVGKVNSQNWLNKIDIFIMPSLWEGLGLAVLEAAASKKPIIASSVDGILEILDNKNSFLYENKNLDQLTKNIDFLLTNLNSQVVQEKIELAYSLVKSKFSLNKMIENYQTIYENITS